MTGSDDRPRRPRAAVLLAMGLAAAHLLAGAPDPAAAVADSGAVGAAHRTTSALGDQRYRPPLDAPVTDPFRAPSSPYGPGNRGLEYASGAGTTVRAIGSGTVAFAGQVGGRLVVSIDHPDGLRSSLVGLARIEVRVGQRVAGGQVVGRSGAVVHLGVRRGGAYLDPATLFGHRGPARLVPRPRR